MKILFPTDFSTTAENAFTYAIKLADRLKASITVVHVYELLQLHTWIEGATNMNDLNEKVTIGEFEHFREQIDTLKRIARENQLEHIEVDYVLKESDYVIEAIQQEAMTNGADLIVMGTKGARGLKEIFFGSVATKVMETAPCPVFVVPETAHFKGIQKIGLTLEYKPVEYDLIEKALRLTRRLGGHLHCVHIDNYDDEQKRLAFQDYRKTFEAEQDISFHIHHEPDTEKGILDFMKFNQMDVIVMYVHPQSLLKDIFSFSIAKRVAYHSDIPILGIH